KRQFLQVGKPAQRTGLGTRTKTLVISDSNETGSPLSPASSQSNRIDGNSPCPNPKHSPTYVQRAFRFLVGEGITPIALTLAGAEIDYLRL
ncbi:MAG: hypothetical protein QNJ32_16360, partial [Xenococcaceae cyanobacterium MO_167.B27]|nr:hypothetical protein [Xenococcaceae cyanobacterium MO_167.B27]